MKYLDLSLPTPEENLALDEALLDACEAGECGGAILRVWESRRHFVVAGFSNALAAEADLDACAALAVSVARRCSGGGTVLQGPGCLNYALVLPVEEAGPTATVTGANRWIMSRHRALMAELLGNPDVQICGDTDLSEGSLKFSGNAQRRRRKFLLFHGAFLIGLDLDLMEKVLRLPTRAPDYRQGRAHRNFVKNLGLAVETLKAGLRRCWGADDALTDPPWARLRRLLEEQYLNEEWVRRR